MSAINYPAFVLPSAKRRLPSAGRFETLAIAVGICLPIPVLAATGLSMPLPNVVERIAAALVPWAEPVALESAELKGTNGTIVPTAAEATPVETAAPAAAPATAPTAPPATDAKARLVAPVASKHPVAGPAPAVSPPAFPWPPTQPRLPLHRLLPPRRPRRPPAPRPSAVR